ncbi:hypothetical protein NCGM2209_0621 [Mycobacterium tuberculosis NCGM2209]|nr:hypothetical protein NCGM2209_0621 [Mycobacterium tuberculosis NCGM2209]
MHRLDDGRRLAGFGCEQLGEQVLALSQHLDRRSDHRRTLVRRGRGPGAVVERRTCCGDRGVDVGGGRHRHLADIFPSGWAAYLDNIGGRRFGPLAADEKLVVFRATVRHMRRSSSSLRSASSPAVMASPYPSRTRNENVFHY